MLSTAMPAANDVLTVVFVSPDPGVRRNYQSRLEIDGYRVRAVADAVDAFREIRQRTPDIVFVDRSSDPGVLEDLAALLRRAPEAGTFPIVCLDARPRQGLLDGAPLTPLGYSLLEDAWWPVSPAALTVVDALEIVG